LVKPVRIRDLNCRTALGDARDTVGKLLEGQSALHMTPIHGEDGGDEGPLALRGDMQKCVPPRWWEDLQAFMAPLAGDGWGSLRRPVFLTSSNYGIDGLYALGRTRQEAHSEWATAHACADKIQAHQGWGENILIFSHACVSAQLGLYQAAQFLHMDLADEVLVLSFDYVGPFVAAGFHALKILNDQMPAPYQIQETGSIGLGDGIACAILSRDGDGPEISAQSLYNEMYHFTGNAPEGIGFTKALADLSGQLDPGSFWIKGHGTGTLEAGRMEAETLHQLFPGQPLVSWKGALGHTLGSCALVELAIALAAVEDGSIPGTVGSTGPCFSPDVQTQPFPAADHKNILLLSNAFGGAHGAMTVRYA
jgi:3-oxoacyl-(acyl-carrier-protein) synthase